jgi:hypothetical protein
VSSVEERRLLIWSDSTDLEFFAPLSSGLPAQWFPLGHVVGEVLSSASETIRHRDVPAISTSTCPAISRMASLPSLGETEPV